MDIKSGKTIVKSTVTLISGLIIALVMFISGCANDPNDLGLNYIPSVDTTGVKFLDSETDTMSITNYDYKYYINNYLSENLLVGNYQNYNSKALIKFYNIPTDYDSAEIISAVLTFRYSNYYFEEKTGNTSFNLFRLLTKLNYSTITFDSVNSTVIGTESMGNFNGVVPDSSSINITLDNDLVNDWLEYAADTAYSEKNYGLALVPSVSSTTIKGFYLLNNNVDYVPTVKVILTKNDVTDTITINASEGLSLSDAPASIIPADRILLQNGIAYRNLMNFDLRKLPSNVIINNATLLFTLDRASSFISDVTDKRVILGMVIDSTTKKDSIFFEAFIRDSITYSVNINQIIQRWNSGIIPNLGISMKNYYELQNLDNFVIYNQFAADITKRPRLKITYTLRN